MILNLGSINVDHVHRVPHFPVPGETLSDTGYAVGLGGKGANMSIAAARAGARVRHVGAVGADGLWTVARLAEAGVDTAGIATVEAATGHAVIYVDPTGENQIVIHGGANQALTPRMVRTALAQAGPGDWLLAQAETNLVAEAAATARARGLTVAYAAAPFDATTAAGMLPLSDLVAVNEGEAEALSAHTGRAPAHWGVPRLLITLGARGARWIEGGEALDVPSFPVTPVDTTGAGDCFLGYALAGLDGGLSPAAALRRAAAAAALQVTRPGAAEAIPTADEVAAFLSDKVQ